MKKILVVAPHPDDETLGCGGTLLKHATRGDETHWLVVSAMTGDQGFAPERIRAREAEIEAVAAAYGFAGVHRAGLPTTRLDTLPMGDVVAALARVFVEVEPHVVYLPHGGDVHSDHRVVFEAASACCKSFRRKRLERVLAYETISETDFALGAGRGFSPTTFVDIEGRLERKIEIMSLYEGETGEFPFPRSERALRALAEVRGAAAGLCAAEAFVLLREVL